MHTSYIAYHHFLIIFSHFGPSPQPNPPQPLNPPPHPLAGQFPEAKVFVHPVPHIRDDAKVEEALRLARSHRPCIIVYSVCMPDIKEKVHTPSRYHSYIMKGEWVFFAFGHFVLSNSARLVSSAAGTAPYTNPLGRYVSR